jgi:hypothetical protein
VLQFGDHGGAIGYLVGEENRGLEYMFIMMNAARFGVGVQGIAVAERAYQQAVAYAKDRVQSARWTARRARAHHPPPRRAPHADDARLDRRLPRDGRRRGLDARTTTRRRRARAEPGLLRVPGAAGQGLQHRDEPEVTLLGVQVHGGMGFIEETGAAQYYRDAKILTIYEGTTAIQANDLVGRKTARDGGQTAKAIAARSSRPKRRWRQRQRRCAGRRSACARAREAFVQVVDFIAGNTKGAQRGVRRLGALPDAGRQPGGRLADGARAARRRSQLAQGEATAFIRPRSPPRASTPSTC